LSKGLSAPIGSLLCGNKEFIERARKRRKMLGGGMRQAGVIAAAGIVAMETMIDRLAEDHTNARRLADGLVRIPDIRLGQEKVMTNILMFDLARTFSSIQFLNKLTASGVKILSLGGNSFRAVTHRMVNAGDIDFALNKIEAACRELK
jgi:threonine aldolase